MDMYAVDERMQERAAQLQKRIDAGYRKLAQAHTQLGRELLLIQIEQLEDELREIPALVRLGVPGGRR